MKLRWAFTSAVIVIAFLVFVGSVKAAFFDAPGVGARSMGTGGAMTALANDPLSALFHNPAALSDVHGVNALAGVSTFFFPVRYKSPTGYNEKNEKSSFAPYFAINSDRFDPTFLGIGMYGSLGSGFDYDKDADHGIFYNFTSEIGNMYLSPTIAYRFNEKISLGFGLNITYGKLEMGMQLPSGEYLQIDADGFCYGVNLGVLYKPSRYLNLGFRWRSRMKAEQKGDANFSGAKDNVKANLYWPDSLTFGLGVHISPQFIVLLDFEWINYSYFSRKSHFTYDKLTFLDGPFLKDMRDAWKIHVGCEYSLNKKVVLRAGYHYDPWCVPEEQTSPLAPGNTWHTFHLGIGLKISDRLDIDIAGMRNYAKVRRITYSESGYPGTYDMPSYVIDLALSYHF